MAAACPDSDDEAITRTANSPPSAVLYGYEPGAACHSLKAWTLSMLCQGQHKTEQLTVQTSTAAGIRVESDKNTLTQNLVLLSSGVRGDGVEVLGSRNRPVANAAEANDGSGFVTVGKQNTFTKNTATGNGFRGFEIHGMKHNLQTNTATDSGGSGFDVNAAQTTLTKNRANANFIGFASTFGTRNTFKGNIATQNSLDGFHIFKGSNHKLLQNRAEANAFVGIRLFQGTENTMAKKNIARNNRLDLEDGNTNCGTNTWTQNTAGTRNQPCIK